MNKQKQILEIFIYVLLLTVGLFFYLNDTPIIEKDNIEPIQVSTSEADGLQEVPEELIEVPEELIYDNFEFEGD